MENLFHAAYMRSFASEYSGQELIPQRLHVPMPICGSKSPDYMDLFYRQEMKRPTNPFTIDHIPDNFWKFRTSFTGKPIVLGNGGWSKVYKGMLTPCKEKVAIKILKNKPMIQYYALKEALIQKYLEDTIYVPKCHGVIRGKSENPGIVMENLKNYSTLCELMSKKNISNDQRLKIALQISDAVCKFHSRHVHHNDLKLDNIMINVCNPDEPVVKIIDFSHATYKDTLKLKLENGEPSTALHLSPEVREGRSTSASSDVYSLGVILGLLSGRNKQIPSLYKLSRSCRRIIHYERPNLKRIVQCIRNIIDKQNL